MSNLTDLGLVEVAGTDVVKNWPAQVDALLNALAALRWRGTDSAAGSSAVLAAVNTKVAGMARVNFTLDRQTRVRITCMGQVDLGGTTASKYELQCAYNPGAFNLATAVSTGGIFGIGTDGSARGRSGTAVAAPLLAAGNWTAYATLQRTLNGTATDAGSNWYTIVEGVSLV